MRISMWSSYLIDLEPPKKWCKLLPHTDGRALSFPMSTGEPFLNAATRFAKAKRFDGLQRIMTRNIGVVVLVSLALHTCWGQDFPPRLEKTASTRALFSCQEGKLVDKLGVDLVFKKNLVDDGGAPCSFDGKQVVEIESSQAFDAENEFTIEAVVRLSKPQEAGYARIIGREFFNPRGGYSLAVRKSGMLAFWASGKSWLTSDLHLEPGIWYRVGAMARGNQVFLFCDNRISSVFDFDDTPCLPTKANVVIGQGFIGDMMDIRISAKALYWDSVLPGKEDWKLPSAQLRDNGYQGDVVLNGWWAGRLEGSTKEYLKVRVPDFGSTPKVLHEFYREFVLPAGWNDRRVVLEMGGFSHDGAVMLDGKNVAEIKKGKRFIEIDLPPKQVPGTPYRLLVRTGMIWDDVWLRSYPRAQPRIEESYITTSYRQKEVHVRLKGRGRGGERVTPVVTIYDVVDPNQAVKTIALRHGVTVDADGRWQVELAASWPDPKLWSRWHPNLYTYTVELADSKGRVTDKGLPRRFGFREVWIENGRFFMNGIPISICDDTWEGTLGNQNVMRQQAEVMLKNLKTLGITGGYRVKCDTIFDVADDVGMLFEAHAGSMVRLNIWDGSSGLTPMTGDEDVADIERLVRRWREHPSIIYWYSNTAYGLAGMHPAYAGQDVKTWFHYPANKNVDRARDAHVIFKQMADLMSDLDPTRVVGVHSSPYSPVDGLTRYLCDNLDLQEREEFFDHWFRSGREKVIWVHEFGIPIMNHYFTRRIDHQMGHIGFYPKVHLEAAARLFGDQAYRFESDETIAEWGKTPYVEFVKLPGVQHAVAEQAYEIWRAWRTYGVNLSAHHVLNKHGFDYTGKRDQETRYGFSEAEDPRRPGLGFVPKREPFPILGVDRILPAGEAILRATKPLFVYIGGPDTRFNNKDHLYYSGAEVRKALIILNDWDEAAAITGEWQLVDAQGIALQKGKLEGSVAAGHRALTEFPIEFVAPVVTSRSDFILKVRVTANLPGELEDRFAITVFPEHIAPKITFTGKMWRMNISDDATHETRHAIINRNNAAFLKATGVRPALVKGLKTFTYLGSSPQAAADLYKGRKLVTKGTPAPGDLLIIPRHTLRAFRDDRQKALRLLESMDLDRLVEQGLRVIVFEQDLPNIFGMVTEDTRPRRVFMAAKGHPVFAGLEASDLTYWSGASDLTHAITPLSHTARQYPDRQWHTSLQNAVATRTLIRPQVGSVRALAVNGFDLTESPLLEVTRGKGRMLFCMMDVTSRYGKDPAATLLVDNMIQYMTTVDEPDPTKSELVTFASDGETVVTKQNLFRAAVPEGMSGWGITQGELFFRESIYSNNWITTELPNVTVPVFAGSETASLPQVIRRNEDRGHFELTLEESLFETGWAQRKLRWIRSALIVNQGGSVKEGPALRHHGRLTDLYPIVWVENFVHPYTADIW